MNELHFIIYILNRAVSAFPDWNPPHFLDTAEISHGIAIGKCVKSIYVGKTYTPIFVSPMNRRHDGNTLLTATPIPATATPTFFSWQVMTGSTHTPRKQTKEQSKQVC